VETYFTIEELAKYLGYAEKTIRKWVLNREIPFHKIRTSIRFRLSEIEKWVDSNGTQKADEEQIDEGGLFKTSENAETLNNINDGQDSETAQTGENV